MTAVPGSALGALTEGERAAVAAVCAIIYQSFSSVGRVAELGEAAG